ncbi:PaaI family thioesterase [Nocardioides humilatus]|uniref:Acyl-coenzyme A thioesterase THEM4 n=1 Tax=Nocardioides humilatus TaxID=2607660 RepID=A0A5B1LMM5_9ACTN|nr:PaaI family thioesterase [Nocardioides humilatus]KAA1421338.1 PaaI family thioesterase [Nocardioides humilatus]
MSTSPETTIAGALTPHHDRCFVCGPCSPAQVELDLRCPGEEGIVGDVVLDARHQGVPGIAHGGAIAAVVDEIAGSVLTRLGVRFVTASLTTTYHAPVMTGERLTCSAWIESTVGRKRTVVVELAGAAGRVVTGRALCVDVPEEHFTRLGLGSEVTDLFGR